MTPVPYRPVNPVELDESAPGRLHDADSIDAGIGDELRAVCALDTDRAARVEASRDWWPLALRWAWAGVAPAAAAAVARPASVDEVAAVMAICDRSAVPVTVAGGRSGVCGGSVPVHGGVVLDLTGLDGIASVDAVSQLVTARAGTFGDRLEAELRGEHGLTLGHWPQSIELSTVGGWVACRSAGQYSTRYGKIEDMVVDLEVVLADGSVIRTGSGAPRSATGPDLTQLFVGSEGTLGIVTAVTLRAHRVPPADRRSAWAFPTFAAGLDACRRILQRGATPAVLRLYDERESRRSFDVDGRCVLLVLDEGEPRIVDAVLHLVQEECSDAEALDVALVQQWLDHRNDVSGLGTAIADGFVVDTCEVAGPWSVLPELYADGIEAVKAVDGTWVASAHESHAYTDGACLYFTFAGKPDDPDAYYRAAWDALTEATLGHGAAISHHHGIGLNRHRFMASALGGGMGVLQAVKDALDPNGILNPGKLGLSSPFGAPGWPE